MRAHTCCDLHVDDVLDSASRGCRSPAPVHLHELTHNLVGDLVAPLGDHRHVDVVDEQLNTAILILPAGGPAVRAVHALVHVALDRSLHN